MSKDLEEAKTIVQRLISERDKAIADGDLRKAKIKDYEANQSRFHFWASTHDQFFAGHVPAMTLTEEQQVEVNRLVENGSCRLIEDCWSGLASRLQREMIGQHNVGDHEQFGLFANYSKPRTRVIDWSKD